MVGITVSCRFTKRVAKMDNINRRDFLRLIERFLTATGLAAVLRPMVAFFYPTNLEETPPDPVRVSSRDDLAVGESISVPFGRYPALVIHSPQGLRAYSAVCTHFSCIVDWNPDTGRIECPCHAG